jgi:hypothetical protein
MNQEDLIIKSLEELKTDIKTLNINVSSVNNTLGKVVLTQHNQEKDITHIKGKLDVVLKIEGEVNLLKQKIDFIEEKQVNSFKTLILTKEKTEDIYPIVKTQVKINWLFATMVFTLIGKMIWELIK